MIRIGMSLNQIRPLCVLGTVTRQPLAGSLDAMQHREETQEVVPEETLLLARQHVSIPLRCHCDARRATQRAKMFVQFAFYHAPPAQRHDSSGWVEQE